LLIITDFRIRILPAISIRLTALPIVKGIAKCQVNIRKRRNHSLTMPHSALLFKRSDFVVHPIVIGEGRGLFEGINLQAKLQLKLAESTVFKSGAVALRYLKQ
jgi:hypothetical protein